MEDITKELNNATEYLRAMKRSGHHKGDCDNVLMHLANIEDLVEKLTIPVVSQQRELLKFFSNQLSENLDIDVGMNYITEEDIEECLKNFNCG